MTYKEYRIRPVTRWIVTEAEVDLSGACNSAGRVIGTYESEESASQVLAALEEASPPPSIKNDAQLQAEYNSNLAELQAMDVSTVRAFWDAVPDDGGGYVGKYSIEEIHMALNLMGDGRYCAV